MSAAEMDTGLYRVDSVSTCSTLATLPRKAPPAKCADEFVTRADDDAAGSSRALASVLSAIYVSASRPTKADIARGVLLPNLFEDPKRREHPAYRSVLSQASELSHVHFHEEALHNVNKNTKWRVLLYCSEDLQDLWGFAVYKLQPTTGILSLAKLAVPSCYRGLGFGRTMVQELIRTGKSVQGLDTIALSSLPEAVAFYTRLGFKKHDGVELPAEDGQRYVEGQAYMDYRFRKSTRPKGTAKKGGSKKGR
jgi:ribosomal protein S18 acetylase RimI-like enzyme